MDALVVDPVGHCLQGGAEVVVASWGQFHAVALAAIPYQQQLRVIDDMSRAPSEASMRVRGDGIDQLAEGYQKLTLDQQQETEKFILHRGTYMR